MHTCPHTRASFAPRSPFKPFYTFSQSLHFHCDRPPTEWQLLRREGVFERYVAVATTAVIPPAWLRKGTASRRYHVGSRLTATQARARQYFARLLFNRAIEGMVTIPIVATAPRHRLRRPGYHTGAHQLITARVRDDIGESYKFKSGTHG